MIAINELQEVLYKIYLRSPQNLFDEFILECQKWYESPAHTLNEMRNRDNKKIRGDIFEAFCVLYLKYAKGFQNVWLLKEVPSEILEKLTMKRQDMGIDIVVETSDGSFIAVQCKYKKGSGFRKNILSWKSLSTFYALCLRTGPWAKYIIITNCLYTRHQGKKTPQDVSYCLKTLQNISKTDWLKMCQISCEKLGTDLIEHASPQENVVINIKSEILSKEELRTLREKYYAPTA